MNMLPDSRPRNGGWLPLLLLLLPSVLSACGGDRLRVESYPDCPSYPCAEEMAWWRRLWREEKSASRRPGGGRPGVIARQQFWKELRRLGYQAEEFNRLCRQHPCNSLQVARYRQRVVYPMQYYVDNGIPMPPARGRPSQSSALLKRWPGPLLALLLLGAGLLAACLRWGLLGAYAFAGAWHELRGRVRRMFAARRLVLPRSVLWPTLWTVSFLLVGWFMLIAYRGWGAAWRLLAGSGP